MTERTHSRRRWLTSCAGATAGLVALAGCTGDSDDGGSDAGGSDENGTGGDSDDGDFEAPPNHDWPVYGGNVQHTGHQPDTTGPTGDEIEATKLYESGEHTATGLVVVDDVLYGTSTDGHVYAVDLETEDELWSDVVDRESIFYGPAVHQGEVYVPSNHMLYAYDAQTGELNWDLEAITSVGTGLDEIRPVDRELYVTGADGVHRIDLDDRESEELLSSDESAGDALAVDDNSLYVVLGASLYALDRETGDEQWSFEHEDGDSVTDYDPVVIDGTVLIGAYAIDAASGEKLWQVDRGEPSTPSYAVADGLAFGVFDEEMVAIDLESGAETWASEAAESDKPVVADGVVYSGRRRRMVAHETGTGDLLWPIEPIDQEQFYRSERLCISNGSLYTVDDEGGVWRWHEPGE